MARQIAKAIWSGKCSEHFRHAAHPCAKPPQALLRPLGPAAPKGRKGVKTRDAAEKWPMLFGQRAHIPHMSFSIVLFAQRFRKMSAA